MKINKFKMTNQRAVILDFLKENHNHPNVEEIFSEISLQLPRISKKTVYNNLSFLSRQGFIREIEVKGVQRFEPVNGSNHHHLICKKCGKIRDIESEELYGLAIRIGKKTDGFLVDHASINIYSICNNCNGGK